MVTIIFSTKACIRLHEIRYFHRNQPKRLKTIVERINKGVEILCVFPQAGLAETQLSNDLWCFYSLVIDKYYKIIYHFDKQTVYIVTIWDCRQNPLKLFDELPWDID
ncbi:type II toxin-antitoxin system RelE/ParE family toxin [Bacteroides sp. 51]|uniref:type II toxin-antitoxin system RelE/ParE family toxin n=1 Tax=Bacteroides sp. 51 TaxID=2302938 RepID=UPI0013D31BE8|nr:type II toxin-antitoxin system RelE/ParE family toxin [Bacteroides sp. 51]